MPVHAPAHRRHVPSFTMDVVVHGGAYWAVIPYLGYAMLLATLPRMRNEWLTPGSGGPFGIGLIRLSFFGSLVELVSGDEFGSLHRAISNVISDTLHGLAGGDVQDIFAGLV